MDTLSMRRRGVAYVVAWVALSCFAGCTHITLISPYDQDTDKAVTAVGKKIDALMTKLDTDPVPAYDSVKNDYDDLRADVAALRLRNAARPNNSLTVQQVDHLAAALKDVEQQHKASRLNQAMVPVMRGQLDEIVGAILKLELTKKELT